MITSLFAALLLQTAPAATPAAAPVCVTVSPPPAGLEAWTTVSGSTKNSLPAAKTMTLTLQPSIMVKFTLPPERAPATGTFSGLYSLHVKTAGIYRIALSGGAWIDLVRDGKTLASVAHTEGPPCSGIRKIVDFALVPGKYTLQLSGAKTADMKVLAAPK